MNSQILLCFELSGVQMTLSQCMPSYVLCVRSNKVAPEVALHEASACGGNFEAEDSWGWTSVAANKVCSWGSLRGTVSLWKDGNGVACVTRVVSRSST